MTPSKQPSAMAMKAAGAIRAYPMSLTADEEFAKVIDREFELLRKSHKDLLEALQSANEEIELWSTFGGEKHQVKIVALQSKIEKSIANAEKLKP